MSIFIDEQHLQDINPEDIRAYLSQKGWQEMRYTDTRLQVFANRQVEGEPVLLLLPVSRKLSDFYPRLVDALVTLAKVEKTTLDSLLRTIRLTSDDIIRMRLLLPADTMPSIELTAQFLSGFRDLVVFAATIEAGETTRYFKRSTDIGKQEAQHFQFCHTSQGSFGFAMASPIIEQRLFPEENPPLSRRVVERITRGLLTVQDAEIEQNPLPISQRYEDGLNANMCYAVATMLEYLQDTKVEYSVDWSLRLRAPQDIAQFQPISLGSASATYLNRAGDHLKEMADAGAKDLGEREIHGEIVALKSNDEENRSVIITSPHFTHDIEATFSEEDYKEACDAHRDKRPISVRGTLISKKGKKTWQLLNAHGLIVR